MHVRLPEVPALSLRLVTPRTLPIDAARVEMIAAPEVTVGCRNAPVTQNIHPGLRPSNRRDDRCEQYGEQYGNGAAIVEQGHLELVPSAPARTSNGPQAADTLLAA